MVRWLRWHCPPDTGFEIRALAVWGRARYLSVTEASHNTDSSFAYTIWDYAQQLSDSKRQPTYILIWMTYFLGRNAQNIYAPHHEKRFVVPRIQTKTGSIALSIDGPALWNAMPVPIRNALTILTFRKLVKSHQFDLIWLSHPSFSVARLPVEEPAFAWIMTHDYAIKICVPLSSVRWWFRRYKSFFDW